MNKKQIFGLLGLMASSAIVPAIAEVIPGTTLSVHFESGQVVGSGRHLNMTQIPVINIDTGERTLYDAAFKFTFDPGEGFIFEQITSVAISPPVSVANIVPGVYKSQSGRCFLLEGPSQLNANRSMYTLRGAVQNEVTNCPTNGGGFTAQIISGAATNHPDIGDRDIVSNLQDTYVYGVIANAQTVNLEINGNWDQNELIGIRQSGDQLIVGLFSDGVDNNDVPNDFKDPRETVILTKVVE